MYQKKITLMPQDILEKEFKIDARGYRPQEVDKFLDIIIRDYVEYGTIIKRLQAEIKNFIIVIVVLVIIALAIKIVFFFKHFSDELKYINIEIERTEGAERKHWKKRKRKLLLSLIPFVKY